MKRPFTQLVGSVSGTKWRDGLAHLSVFFLLVAPVIFVALFSYQRLQKVLTEQALSRREAVAYLSAATFKGQFDRLTDIAISLATRVQFRQFISEGKWNEAVKILESVPGDFPFIERLFLTDAQGILLADTPELPGVRGKDFTFRDWYKGVSKNWEPYVSEIYKRTAPPQYNVVATAAPIKGENQKILGILVLQVRLDTLVEWTSGVEIGQSGFVYFVDRNGHAANHPRFPPQGEIADFSNFSIVQKVLQGQIGVEVGPSPADNQEEVVISYAPISKYGWGAVVEQPAAIAFATRRQVSQVSLIFYALFVVLAGAVGYVIVWSIHTVNAARQREKTFLESVGDGVVAIDRYWNIILWNKAATVISGWPGEETLGKPFREIMRFIREKDRKENIEFIERAMSLGQVQLMGNSTLLLRKDGKEVPVGDSAAPIFDNGRKVIGAIIVFRDVSREKEAQMLRSDFAYASHQLRTPVTEALWNTELALSENDPSAQKKDIEIVYHSLRNVYKLVTDLLEVSEIDQGMVIPKRTEVKLSSLISETLRALQKTAAEREVEIMAAPVSETAAVYTDSVLLQKVLTKIVENAVYYSPRKGVVEISMGVQDKEVLLEIRDSGIGIPAEQQALVFTKFFRGANVPGDVIGAGLGLYLSREYVKLLGGKIWFKSEANKGASFFIALPVKPF